ncbi:MAG TPA: L-histidine N(alpha)-methyltransferase [Verrucomicrobiae bacterium]|nr:L-histidine N(alpha)-methyltransferase [Verrucomicrobiae bacterium]
MTRAVSVLIHESQFPSRLRTELLESFRTQKVNHKFLYDSVRQTSRWQAVHEACSPAHNDPEIRAVYDRGFEYAATRLLASQVELVALGCGGGHKDARFLQVLRRSNKAIACFPCDVSTPMVLTARETILNAVPSIHCSPVVCDLASVQDSAELFPRPSSCETRRFVTFFGMIPNFEPSVILPRLAAMLSRDDLLLFSANLAPGPDYAEGLRRVLPQYDNAPTREWLFGFLYDHGVEPHDGELRFSVVEPDGNGLKRIEATFSFQRACSIRVEGESFSFSPGDAFRLFFSYRYTPGLLETELQKHGLIVRERWVAHSGEEGVFLVVRD